MPKENIILGKQLNEELKYLKKKLDSIESAFYDIKFSTENTYNFLVETDDSIPKSPKRDSFNKLRVSEPFSLFDSKLLGDNRALFWDDQEVSGSGTGSSYSRDRASETLTVSNLTAGKRVRQTFQRFNYQPGKAQCLMMTFVPHPPEDGIIQEMGLNDGSNGLFLRIDGATVSVVIKSNASGTPVDTVIEQKDWNLNKLPKLDLTKAQIFTLDYESLQVGSVRFGFVIGGSVVYCHIQEHANIIDSVYFSTPNLPIRYSIENDGTGGAASLECVCSTVISEGGQDETGIVRSISTGTTAINAVLAGTRYALLGIRLKSTHLDNIIQLVSITTLATTNDNYEWSLILNPSVAGTFTYTSVSNSAIESAVGATANTVTGGTILYSGFAAANSATSSLVKTLRYLGSNIAGTTDTIVLCVRSLTTNGDFHATIDFRETS